MHMEKHAAAVRHAAAVDGTNGYDLYMRKAIVGKTIQTVNSPI